MSSISGTVDRQSKQKAIVIIGASCSDTVALASAIAAAQGVEMIEAGADIGLISVLTAAEQDYRRDIASVGEATTPSRSAADGVLDGLVGGRTGTLVLHAADVLPGVPCLKAAPVLAARWPEAMFVNLSRDGVDFVASRRRALPDVDFLTDCLLWSGAQRAWNAAAPALAGCAIVVQREALIMEADVVAAHLADRWGWSQAARGRFVAALRQRSGDDAAFGSKPMDFVRVGWTLAEKMLFADICGEAMTALGTPLDLASAIRRSPLRLDDMIGAGHAVLPGRSGTLVRHPGSVGLAVTWAADVEDGILVLPAIALSGRNRLTLAVGTVGDKAAPAVLRIDIVESISRRSCASVEALIHAAHSDLSTTVDSTPDLVDIVFSVRSAVAGKGFGFRLFDGSLSA